MLCEKMSRSVKLFSKSADDNVSRFADKKETQKAVTAFGETDYELKHSICICRAEENV